MVSLKLLVVTALEGCMAHCKVFTWGPKLHTYVVLLYSSANLLKNHLQNEDLG